MLTPIEYELINRTALLAAKAPSQQKPGQSGGWASNYTYSATSKSREITS